MRLRLPVSMGRTFFLGTFLLSCLSMQTAFAQTSELETDWQSLRHLLSGIQGVSTAPPKGIVTPKYTSGALMGNGDIGVVAGDTTTSQKFYFGKSDFWGSHWNTRHNAFEVSILSLGSLTISSPVKSSSPEAAYRMEQDILNAEVRMTLKLGDSLVHLRSWTANGENIFVTEISADQGGTVVPLDLSLAMPAPDPEAHTVFPAAAGQRDGLLWASRENNLTQASDYKAKAALAVRLLDADLKDVGADANSAHGRILLKPGSKVWLVATFASDARIGLSGPQSEELVRSAIADAQKLTVDDLTRLQMQHREWWKQFWLRSYVRVNDKVLEDYYYGALYVLGASSRPGHLPPSLWGNFLTTDNAAWGGRYFMNYNEEAPYYGVFSSNHAELAEPYNRMVLAQMPYQRNRTAQAGYQGVSFQRTFSPFTVISTPPAPVQVATSKDYKHLPSDQKSNATFSLLPTLQYYEYTQDTDFLRSQLYPALKQLDAFWRDFAVRDSSGKHWVFEHSSAHEGGDDVNPNLDIGFAISVEKALINASRVLGVDAEMRPIWQQFLAELSPYPQGIVNGKQVYYIADAIKNDIKNQGLFEPGDQPINLEGLVFPGENLAIGGDATELQIARNSMEFMNSWGVTRGGNTNNGFCKIFPIAARIGWPAEDLVEKFKAAILYQWRPSNLTVFQGGGGIETSGSIEALDSMLLQHEDGVLRLFPDWPVARDASFKRLRAKGAFLISSELLKGKVAYIDIVSEKGGPLLIQSPWKSAGVKIVHMDSHGNSSNRKGEKVQPLNERISLVTEPGERYRVTSEY